MQDNYAKSKKIHPLLHFIWAGGKNPMNELGVRIVKKWAEKHNEISNLKIYIWIDKSTASIDVVDEYKKFFEDYNVFDEIEDEKNTKGCPIILKDINLNKMSDKYVQYEIEKLRPNYGSSSDILRYKILFVYGGFYCDCTDVNHGKHDLKFIFEEKYLKDILYVEHCPQQENPSQQSLGQFNKKSLKFVGNDAFATNANNKVMELILQRSYDQYQFEELGNLPIYEAHSGNSIKEKTIERTGPVIVQSILSDLICQSEDDDEYFDEENETTEIAENLTSQYQSQVKIWPLYNVLETGACEVRTFRGEGYSFTQPEENTTFWLKAPIKKCDSVEESIFSIIKTIQFEANYFKILRLDDHIIDIIESTKDISNDDVKITFLLDKLNDTIQTVKNDIKYTQLTGKFAETIDYAKKEKLFCMFHLDKENRELAIKTQSGLFSFNFVIYYLTEEFAQTHNYDYDHDALELKEQIKKECSVIEKVDEIAAYLYGQIKQGLEFIECFIDKINVLTPENNIQETAQLCVDILTRFRQYSESLNKKIKSGLVDLGEFNLNKIDNLIEKFKQIGNPEKLELKTQKSDFNK